MGSKRPPRLPDFDYLGVRAYFLTICAEGRERFFGDPQLARDVSTQFVRIATDYRFAVIAYCLMPDHLHGLIEGLVEDSDFRKFVSMFKQKTSFIHRQHCGKKLWQEGYHEHVLRDEEAPIEVAAYVLNNPIRAGLCEALEGYPFMGSGRYTLRELSEAVQFKPE